ncbi:MAG: FGGY family carbohydrate kinase [Planctomycetota bacterium]
MSLLAGACALDISPRQGAFLAGYPYVERRATGVHDPLWASALCLRSGGRALLILTLDLLFIDTALARKLRRDTAAGLDIEESAVFIGCTHTHSGPVTIRFGDRGHPFAVTPAPDPEYLCGLEALVLEAARGASAACRPAVAAWSSARVQDVGGNRHDPDGPSDPEAGILAVRDKATGLLLGASVVYAMHPTVLHEDSTLISSDFPHFVREEIRACFGPQVTTLYHTGAAGNQSPRHHVKAQTFEEARRLGGELGRAICRGMKRLAPAEFRDDLRLDSRLSSVDLVRRAIPARSEAEDGMRRCRAIYDDLRKRNAPSAQVRTAECDLFGADSVLQLTACNEAGRLEPILSGLSPADVQALRIGDGFLIGLPGELFVEYALDIKARTSVRTHIIGLVNGDLMGYIVTEEASRQNWYEAHNRVFEPASGRRIADAAVRLVADMRGHGADGARRADGALTPMAVLSLDLGSTSLKAGVFGDGLALLGTARHPLGCRSITAPGSAEFGCGEFLAGIRQCIRDAMASAAVRSGDIGCISVTSQAQTFVITDRGNRPQGPFVSWMDWGAGETCARMSGEAPWTGLGEHASFSELLPPLTVCLLKQRMDRGLITVGKAGMLQFLPTFLCSMFGTAPLVDRNLAAMSGLYSLTQDDWWSEALADLGLGVDNLPRVRATGEVCAVTGSSARGFGLASGIPIVLAGNDQTAGAFGAELHRNGNILVTLGTAHVAYAHKPGLPAAAPGLIRGPYPGGGAYLMAAESRGGNVTDWAARKMLGELRRDEFFALAAASPAGANGLGFRADPRGCGEWLGRRPGHRPADQARSVLECLAGIIGEMLDRLDPARRAEVLVAGGGSTQPAWLEIIGKRTGRNITRSLGDPLRGAALMTRASGR